MARIHLIAAREDLPPEQQPAFEEIADSRGGRVAGPFQVLLHSPELARRIAHTGSYVRFDSTLPADVRELAIIASARANDCQYEWAAHEPLARSTGVRPEAIAAIRDGTAPAGLTSQEALVVGFTHQLLKANRVSEATFAAALETFGTQGLVELTATIGYYSMLACALIAFDVQPERPA